MNTKQLSGKTVLITGANSGIGLETSVELARMGAEVVMVARDAGRGAAALADVKDRGQSEKVSLLLCDFSSQKSIRAFVAEFRAKHPRLHILVNNAGSVNDSRILTEDGLEQTFAVNHLGYFLVTHLLIDVLEQSAPARIVNVASGAHYSATMDFEDLGFEREGYSIMKAYSRSKLANVLFTHELARRLDPAKVTATSLHPGAVATHIWSHAPWYTRPLLAVAKRLMMISPEKGAETVVHLASSPDVEGRSGGYYANLKQRTPSPLARDEAVARKLWDVSARLVGVSPELR